MRHTDWLQTVEYKFFTTHSPLASSNPPLASRPHPTAKNLILGGVKSVTLHDPAPVEIADLGAQFYLAEAHVGRPRAASCVADLADLNRNVKVELLDAAGIDEALLRTGRFQLVVLTECTTDEQVRVNSLCRQVGGVGFVSADVRGLMAACFVDLGPRHVIADATGEPAISRLIASVTQVLFITKHSI